MSVCVCVCACARARVCACVRVRVYQLVIEREQALSEAAEKTSHVWTVLANLAKPEIISGIVCC